MQSKGGKCYGIGEKVFDQRVDAAADIVWMVFGKSTNSKNGEYRNLAGAIFVAHEPSDSLKYSSSISKTTSSINSPLVNP